MSLSVATTTGQPGLAALPTLSRALVELLSELDVGAAFGLTGGAAAGMFAELAQAPFPLIHCRHEGGAAFAATEAYFASGRPSVVFTTTGPGLTNALTGLLAARQEGAKLVVLSAFTSAPMRGRGAAQESSALTLPMGLYQAGPVFHYATVLEHPAELEVAAARLVEGFQRPEGFVAHIAIPTALQRAPALRPLKVQLAANPPVPSEETLLQVRQKLVSHPFVIWAGFGARHASEELLALASKTGAKVICSPRAKGVFPEDHPQYLGVSGLAGHPSVQRYFAETPPTYALVLGTRLGEATSYWESELLPKQGFIQVDTDPAGFSGGYPQAQTFGVRAEIKEFLTRLLPMMPSAPKPVQEQSCDWPEVPEAREEGPVRAHVLLSAVQRHVVEGSDAVVLAEPGNAFAWANNLLRFPSTQRYRVSVNFGSMGHATTGVVGAAIGRKGKAVALVGDGSMLMNHEVSTAVAVGAQAVWVVMNDSSYGMVQHGMSALGMYCPQMAIPETNFALLARSVGAKGEVVTSELELDAALSRAMSAEGPYVLDVKTDPQEVGPWIKRVQMLILQGQGKATKS